MKTDSPNFSFSRYLSDPVSAELTDTDTWRWIASFRPEGSTCSRERRHRQWAKVTGNTHAPPHREVMLTVRGNAIYSLENRLVMRTPGTVILLDGHERRDLKGAPWKHDFSCLWLQLHGRSRLTYYLNHCDAQGRHRHEPPVGLISEPPVLLLNEAWDHCAKFPGDSMGWSLLRGVATTLLLSILGSASPASVGGTQQEIIQSLVETIEAHHGEKLRLHSLARMAGYSPHYFHRLFAAYTGQTPTAFVNAVRFRRAQELLRQGYTVEAAGSAVGFSSTSYFSDFFKRQSGMSPGAWRRQ